MYYWKKRVFRLEKEIQTFWLQKSLRQLRVMKFIISDELMILFGFLIQFLNVTDIF